MTAESPCRILLVTRNLPPLVGGMERLNWHMAEQLAKAASVGIVGPKHSTPPPGVSITEAPLRPLWKFLLAAQWHAVRQARRLRPDVVLAGSGLTAPAAWLAARVCGGRTAVYVHGLDLAVQHPVYKLLWHPALRRMDRVITNSTPTRELAEAIGIRPERIGIVHPGVELPAQQTTAARGADSAGERLHAAHQRDPDLPRDDDAPPASAQVATPPDWSADAFRAEHELGDRPLLLSVGRLSSRKGLREFVSQALPAIVAQHPGATLLVVGDAPNDALRAEAQTPASIRAVAAERGLQDNLRFLGVITDQELGRVYRASDLHVFPVRTLPGDPEGFGMVAVEAAAHGLPTVAFATGGIIDAVAEGESGHLALPGDYAALAQAANRVLASDGALRSSCIAFAQRFAWPRFGERLVAQLRESDAA